MKLSQLIYNLQNIMDAYGDIEVQLQNTPSEGERVIGYESFFVLPEEYDTEEGEETICNIRSWPY